MTNEQLLDQAKAAPGWEVFEYRPAGVLEGFAMLKGTELHCHLFAGMPFRRSEMREFLRPMHARSGFLTTRVAHDDAANQRFNRVFGFERTWSDEKFHYFLMAELPFGKENLCR